MSEGGEIGSSPELIPNPKYPDPEGNEPELIPGDVFTVILCDTGIQSCSIYTDVIEHELVHARDFCNPFEYPPFPVVVGDWIQWQKCMFRERRAYTRECENQHPGNPEEIEKCIKDRTAASCLQFAPA